MPDRLLVLLWITATTLIVFALTLLLLLILVRWVHALLSRRRRALRDELLDLLQDLLSGTPPVQARFDHFRRDRLHTAMALIDLAGLVDGKELRLVLDRLNEEGFDRRFAGLVKSRDRRIRLIGLDVLGLLGGPFATHILQRAFDHQRHPGELVATAQALQLSGAYPDLGPLVDRITRPGSQLPGALTPFLATVARRRPAALVGMLEDKQPAPDLEIRIIQALGRARIEAARPALVKRLSSPRTQTRVAAVAAIAAIGSPADTATLLACCQDPSPEVRAETADALGRAVVAEAPGHLTPLLHDLNWDVRFRAATALLRFGPAGIRQLDAAAKGPGGAPGTRTAAMVLAEQAV